ncbi:MAG: hypothetical protein VX405_11520 [Myxococcota bacterium]|nr:hypothetical protein [Myxococcota bacterium]
MSRVRRFSIGMAITCCLAWHPSVAQASSVGDREVALAGATVATGWEPSAIHYNPAGLARLQRGSLSLSANAYQYETRRLAGFVRSVDEDGNAVESQYESSGFMSFPASMIYAFPLKLGSLRAGAAAGLLVPEAGELHEVDTLDEGFWATHWDQTTRRSVYVPTVGLGFGAARWSLGLALNLRIAQTLEQSYYSDGSIEEDTDSDGMNYQDMAFRSTDLTTVSLSPSIGLQLALPKAWYLGLSAQIPGIHLYGAGKVSAVAFEGFPDVFCDPSEPDSSPGCWFFRDVETTASAREASQGHLQVGLGRRQAGARDAYELTAGYWLAAIEPNALVTDGAETDEDLAYVDFGDHAIERPAAWSVALGWERQIRPKTVFRLGLSHREDAADLVATEDTHFAQIWSQTGLSVGFGRRRAATARQKASSTDLALRVEHLGGQAVGVEWGAPDAGSGEASEVYQRVDGSGFRVLLILGGSLDLGD